MNVRIINSYRVWNEKTKEYVCKIEVKVNNDIIALSYSSKTECLHYLFCDLIDDKYCINNSKDLFTLFTLLAHLNRYIEELYLNLVMKKRGIKNE